VKLVCRKKGGIEIDQRARAKATKIGVCSFGNTDEMDDLWADVVISYSALEHTKAPLFKLRKISRKLILALGPSEQSEPELFRLS
jgi:hypothetical protein